MTTTLCRSAAPEGGRTPFTLEVLLVADPSAAGGVPLTPKTPLFDSETTLDAGSRLGTRTTREGASNPALELWCDAVGPVDREDPSRNGALLDAEDTGRTRPLRRPLGCAREGGTKARDEYGRHSEGPQEADDDALPTGHSGTTGDLTAWLEDEAVLLELQKTGGGCGSVLLHAKRMQEVADTPAGEQVRDDVAGGVVAPLVRMEILQRHLGLRLEKRSQLGSDGNNEEDTKLLVYELLLWAGKERAPIGAILIGRIALLLGLEVRAQRDDGSWTQRRPTGATEVVCLRWNGEGQSHVTLLVDAQSTDGCMSVIRGVACGLDVTLATSQHSTDSRGKAGPGGLLSSTWTPALCSGGGWHGTNRSGTDDLQVGAYPRAALGSGVGPGGPTGHAGVCLGVAAPSSLLTAQVDRRDGYQRPTSRSSSVDDSWCVIDENGVASGDPQRSPVDLWTVLEGYAPCGMQGANTTENVRTQLLTVALETLPALVQQEVGEHFGALSEEAGLDPAEAPPVLLRQALMSTMLAHPEAQVQLSRWGMTMVCLAVVDEEADTWSEEGILRYARYGRYLPAGQRTDDRTALPKAEVGRMQIGHQKVKFQQVMMGALVQMPDATSVRDRKPISVWLKSELEDPKKEAGPYYAVLHPLELLAAVFGFTIQPEMVGAARELFGSVVLVSTAEYTEMWTEATAELYSDGEERQLAKAVWELVHERYGSSHVGPYLCSDTDEAGSGTTAPVVQEEAGQSVATVAGSWAQVVSAGNSSGEDRVADEDSDSTVGTESEGPEPELNTEPESEDPVLQQALEASAAEADATALEELQLQQALEASALEDAQRQLDGLQQALVEPGTLPDEEVDSEDSWPLPGATAEAATTQMERQAWQDRIKQLRRRERAARREQAKLEEQVADLQGALALEGQMSDAIQTRVDEGKVSVQKLEHKLREERERTGVLERQLQERSVQLAEQMAQTKSLESEMGARRAEQERALEGQQLADKELASVKADLREMREQLQTGVRQWERQVAALEAEVPTLKMERDSAVEEARQLREQAEARDQSQSSGSDSQSDAQQAQLKKKLRSVQNECRAQRATCSQMVNRMVELRSELEDAQLQLESGAAGGETDQPEVGMVMNAVRTVHRMVMQQVGELGLPLEQRCEWLEVMSQLLDVQQHEELEQRLKARLELTPAVQGVQKPRKSSREQQRRSGDVQMQEVRRLQKELWGSAPLDRVKELRKHLERTTEAATAVQALAEWEELDLQRTMLLERLLWSAVQGAGRYPVPKSKDWNSGDESALAEKRVERETHQEERSAAEAKQKALQKELKGALETVTARLDHFEKETKITVARYEGQTTALRRAVQSAKGETATAEQENGQLIERLSKRRQELLALTAKLEAVEYANTKLEIEAQRSDRAQQEAAATAEQAAQRQREVVQRQLEQAHERLAQQRARILELEGGMGDLDAQLARSHDDLQQVATKLQEERSKQQSAPATGAPHPAATPTQGSPNTLGEGAGSLRRSRTPGLGSLTRDPEHRSGGSWLLMQDGQEGSGQAVNEPRVVAWVAGTDSRGTMVAIDTEDVTAVNKVSWFAGEASLAGAWLWQVDTRTAAAVDTGVTEAQLEEFEQQARRVLPDLPTMVWSDVFSDGEEDGYSEDDSGTESAAWTGRRVQVRGEIGTVTAVQGMALSVRLESGWPTQGIAGPRRLWVLQGRVSATVETRQASRARRGPRDGGAAWKDEQTAGGSISLGRSRASPARPARPSQATQSGSAMFEQIQVTRDEHKLMDRWMEKVGKANCAVKASWTMAQFTSEGEVRGKMQRLREFLLIAARSGELSAAAVAYGTWRQLAVNNSASKLVRKWFRVNEQHEAVGRAVSCEGMEMGEWLDVVFHELTGVDYSRYGRTQQLAPFGLNENWRWGMARSLVEQWVDCIRDEPIRRTWPEAERDVQGLLKATTFPGVLTPRVMPRAEMLYRNHAGQADAGGYWRAIEQLVVDYLEGPTGIYNDWVEFKESPARYQGPYKVQFLEVGTDGEARQRATRTGYARPAAQTPSRVNETRESGYDWTSDTTYPEEGALCAVTEYASQEEAQKHAMEPCDWHVRRMMAHPNNKLSEQELRAKMHPTCACLNTRNPLLRCTLLSGGVEAIVQREQMPSGEEKEQLWKEQMMEVRGKLRQMQGRVQRCAEEEEIHETGDGIVHQTINGITRELQIAGPPCF